MTTTTAALNKYAIWGKVRLIISAEFEVEVIAVPLHSEVAQNKGEVQQRRCATLREANELRDKLVAEVRGLVEGRGDQVLSVDITLGA